MTGKVIQLTDYNDDYLIVNQSVCYTACILVIRFHNLSLAMHYS